MYFYVFSFCFYFTQNYYVSFISILKIIIYKQPKKIPVHTAKTQRRMLWGFLQYKSDKVLDISLLFHLEDLIYFISHQQEII